MNELVVCTFQYDRLDHIGNGWFGNVYRIHDRQLCGDFAVKEINAESMSEDAVDALFREARAMHASACPNVVPVRAAGRTESCVAIVMPYFKNGSLLSAIQQSPLSLRRARSLALNVLRGIRQIHSAGLVHFDIKPSNVLYGDDGSALVADFGLAAAIQDTGYANADQMYPTMMPPESLESYTGNAASDIYQIGMTLYRAVNGEHFYRSELTALRQRFRQGRSLNYFIERGQFPNRKRYLPHVPKGLRRVINNALQVEPARRFRNSTQFEDAFVRVNWPLDWHTCVHGDGSITWTADRDAVSSYRVELRATGGRFETDVFLITEKTQQRRRPGEFSCSNLETQEDAFKHLDGVFAELS